MKVLHLSTDDQRGGAASAAWRLHAAQRAIGADSRMLVRTKRQESNHVSATDDGTLTAWHEKIATPWLQRRLTPGAPWFTSACFHSFLETHPWVAEANVLHLHWVAEWLSAEAVARLVHLGKPVFWTLHDLWPVTCGSHFAGSNSPADDAWQTGANMPPALREIAAREFERKHQHLSGLPLRILSPSRWLADMVKRSRIGAGWDVSVIPNGIDTDLFRPAHQSSARTQLNLPADKVLLLFGCQALSEHRKGFSVLREALRIATADASFQVWMNHSGAELILFGADKPDLGDLKIPMRHLGSIAGEKAMTALYQAADAFLCPTLEDNLPTTVIESHSCGVPVLGFATGGVPDLVQDEATGLLAECGDASALASIIVRFCTDAGLRKKMQAALSSSDRSQYSAQTQAQRTLELYGASPVIATASSNGTPSVIFPCAMIPSEESWLVLAAAESVRLAADRETALRRKLDDAKKKLLRKKAEVQPRDVSKKKAGWFRRWWRH